MSCLFKNYAAKFKPITTERYICSTHICVIWPNLGRLKKRFTADVSYTAHCKNWIVCLKFDQFFSRGVLVLRLLLDLTKFNQSLILGQVAYEKELLNIRKIFFSEQVSFNED